MPGRRLSELDRSGKRREITRAAVSVVVAVAALLTTYYLVPFDRRGGVWVGVYLVVAAVVYAVSLTRQLRRVVLAGVPELRAIQAVVISVLLFLVLFAAGYLGMSGATPGSFSEQLDHTRALYFAVTVLSTVGFGDITPVTGLASIVVATQMLLDLVVIGVVVRSFVAAARLSVGGRHTPGD